MSQESGKKRLRPVQAIALGVFVVVDIVLIAYLVMLFVGNPPGEQIADAPTPEGFVAPEDADASINYCLSETEAICGDQCCNVNIENTDTCAQDCPCFPNGICEPGEGASCADCVTADESPASACGVACPTGDCPPGLTCTEAGICDSEELCVDSSDPQAPGDDGAPLLPPSENPPPGDDGSEQDGSTDDGSTDDGSTGDDDGTSGGGTDDTGSGDDGDTTDGSDDGSSTDDDGSPTTGGGGIDDGSGPDDDGTDQGGTDDDGGDDGSDNGEPPYGYGSSLAWDDPFVEAEEARSERRAGALTVVSTLLTASALSLGAFVLLRDNNPDNLT
ncbi:MAG: hypothetical protein GYB64_10250 [Chloroflexi bacterium]|nr:hypothetical protein [Chloroflexota bacterium]